MYHIRPFLEQNITHIDITVALSKFWDNMPEYMSFITINLKAKIRNV